MLKNIPFLLGLRIYFVDEMRKKTKLEYEKQEERHLKSLFQGVERVVKELKEDTESDSEGSEGLLPEEDN